MDRNARKNLTLALLMAGPLMAADPPRFTIELPPRPTIEPGSAADVSKLFEPPTGTGRPAGSHGFLRTEQDQFQFEDGQAVRLWGANWPAVQPMPAGEQAAALAQRLARQGINLLRVFLPGPRDPGELRRFEEFSGCLRAQGVCLDLVLPGDTDQLARTNQFTRFAPSEDAGIVLMEFLGPPQTRDAIRRRRARVPVAAAGTLQSAADVTPLGATEFFSQTVKWTDTGPMVKSSRTLLGPMGFGAPLGRPWLVGAWSVTATNPFRAELPLWTAAIASFQRWAGVCLARDLVGAGTPDGPLDIVAWAWAPASALLFQRGDVAPAKSKMLFQLTPNNPAAATLRGDNEQFATAFSMGMTRFIFDAAETAPFGWMILGGTELAGVSALNPRTSDTGEITHDRDAGRLKIDTPRTQAVIGFFPSHPVETRDLRLTFTNGVFTAIAATSLDGEPLMKSQRVLVTATGRADPSGAPRLEPLAGTVTLRWLAPTQRDRKVFALDLTGHRTKEVPLEERGFRLQPELKSAWYEIVAESALPKPPPQTNAPPAKVEKKLE